jgi:CRISPR-associated protein Cas2
MAWILVFFDLPVGTKKERKMASDFRKWLLNDGYNMIQFSIYGRPCPSQEYLETHKKRISKIIPENGSVQILFVTDRQWELSTRIFGPQTFLANKVLDYRKPYQMQFW